MMDVVCSVNSTCSCFWWAARWLRRHFHWMCLVVDSWVCCSGCGIDGCWVWWGRWGSKEFADFAGGLKVCNGAAEFCKYQAIISIDWYCSHLSDGAPGLGRLGHSFNSFSCWIKWPIPIAGGWLEWIRWFVSLVCFFIWVWLVLVLNPATLSVDGYKGAVVQTSSSVRMVQLRSLPGECFISFRELTSCAHYLHLSTLVDCRSSHCHINRRSVNTTINNRSRT